MAQPTSVQEAAIQISDEDFSMASNLLVEVAALRRQLAQKDILLAQQANQIEIMSSKQKDFELHASKLEAAVTHRDNVIAELATSRKLVFEECHRACVANQAELRQMQDALHRVTRQLQRERREHAARIKELRRNSSSSSSLSKASSVTCGTLSPCSQDDQHASEMPWDYETELDIATGLGFIEGIDDVIPAPRSPPNSKEGPSSSTHAMDDDDDDEEVEDEETYRCDSPPTDVSALHPEEVDFLTW